MHTDNEQREIIRLRSRRELLHARQHCIGNSIRRQPGTRQKQFCQAFVTKLLLSSCSLRDSIAEHNEQVSRIEADVRYR